MKIGGVVCDGPPICDLPLPFGDGVVLFKAQGIPNYDEFNLLAPTPEPPVKVTPEGSVKDYDNPNYKHDMEIRELRRSAYLIVKSLEPSNIEWDSVMIDEPKTWMNYEKDLLKAGFNIHQINRILDLVAEANGLSEEKMQWARDVFQHGRLAQHLPTRSRPTEPETTPSGEPAND